MLIFPVTYFLLDEHKKSSTLNITPISKKYTTPSRVVFQKVTDKQNVTPSTSNHQYEADIQNVQVAFLTNDATNTPSVSPLVNSNEQNLNFQKLILKYLTSLKVEVSNISDTQQEIIKLVNNIQNKTQVDDSWANEIDYFVSSWPISDHDGLNDMENKIKSDSNFRKQVVNELARIGGKSLQNMIYKMLKKVFDDHILLGFTYYGLRKKDNFSLMAINKVIIEAVLKSKFKNHSNDDIITAISKWLTGAKGRLLKKDN
uniref:DUF4806 domain-containing protein n=1 Tax=Schizaphis graminum TaxID=13262 RepID=A0A2S2P374_SCHGA